MFKSTVRTVPIYATVVDASGRLVPDLEQADFTVLDNGKPADVALFSNESQPFTAVVMLDTSASMTANLKLLNRAAEQFLLRLLPVDQRAGRRLQRQDPVERHVHQQSRRADRRAERSVLRQPDAPQRRHCRRPRRAAGHRRPPRRAGVHRRRRHLEPDRLQDRARARARRRSDGLFDRAGVRILQRHARGAARGRHATCARFRTKPAAAISSC